MARTTIALGRQHPIGALVTVAGTVITPPGAFRSGTSDEGFVVHDDTGGIYVSVDGTLPLDQNTSVRVTGRLDEYCDQRILKLAGVEDITILGTPGLVVVPTLVPTGAIGAATVGCLVQIQGRVMGDIQDDLPYGYRLFVDDGSGAARTFVYSSTDIDVRSLTPDQPVCLTGIGWVYLDHYELAPRFQDDMVIV